MKRISDLTTILKRTAFLASFMAGSMHATTIISNLPAPGGTTGFAASGGTYVRAPGFTMPGGVSYELTSLDVQLIFAAGNVPGGDPYSFSLYANTPSSGSPLTTFHLPTTVSTAGAIYNLTPNSPVTLLGGATYYLAYSVTGFVAGAGTMWFGQAAPSGIASSTGTEYQIIDGVPNPFAAVNTFGYAVYGSAVPEPGSMTTAAGVFALILLHWRRRI